MDRTTRAAQVFLDARLHGRIPAALAADELPATPAEAYSVHALVGERLGARPAGWKVSLMADGNAVFAPILAPLVVESGATIAVSPIPRLGIELEFAFHFARAVPVSAGAEAILAAIEAVSVAIELCQTRFASPDGHPPLATLADFQNNRGAVLGTRRHFDRSDPFAAVRTELLADGTKVVERIASHPNGDPLAGLLILPRLMATYGRSIESGQFVITGSFIGINWFDVPPDGARITFEGRTSGFGSAIVTAVR